MTHDQRAMLLATQKLCERMLAEDDNGELPPDYYKDLSNSELTLKFPRGTVVFRDRGTNGDGSIFKKASQNLNGYGIICLLAQRLRLFRQWDAISTVILDVIRQAVLGNKTTLEQLRSTDPTFTAQVEAIREELALQPRKEPTPRVVKQDERFPPTVTFKIR